MCFNQHTSSHTDTHTHTFCTQLGQLAVTTLVSSLPRLNSCFTVPHAAGVRFYTFGNSVDFGPVSKMEIKVRTCFLR